MLTPVAWIDCNCLAIDAVDNRARRIIQNILSRFDRATPPTLQVPAFVTFKQGLSIPLIR